MSPKEKTNSATGTLVLLFALVLLLVSCGKKAEIVGEVLDGFGAPLKDVVVSTEGTTFKSTTDGNGKYSVQYVPGKVRVGFSKDRYVPAGFSTDIATEATFPAKPIVLYKIPATNGIFLLGKSDYLPLRGSPILDNYLPDAGRRIAASGEFTWIERAGTVRFLHYGYSTISLVKLHAGDVIADNKLEPQIIKEQYHALLENPWLMIRQASLDPGKYAFVDGHRFKMAYLIGIKGPAQ